MLTIGRQSVEDSPGRPNTSRNVGEGQDGLCSAELTEASVTHHKPEGRHSPGGLWGLGFQTQAAARRASVTRCDPDAASAAR